MGNYLPPNEEELYRSVARQYFLDNRPYLLHRTTNQYCTLHKITAHSEAEATNVQQNIEEYSRSHCQSICRLKTHYLLDMRGYCSNEQNYYLLFEGNNYTLRDQLSRRRSNHFCFSEEETFQIVQTYLCGLRQYNQRFQRNYNQISLQSIVVDQQGKMQLKDPWLNTDTAEKRGFDTTANLLQTYPSPQKLYTAFNSKMGVYNEFDSNLFSVGVIGLQMMKLDDSSSCYIKKQINLQEVGVRLRDIKKNQLRAGLECLLNLNPDLRKNVFLIWQVENKKQHFIHLFGEDKNSTTPNIRISAQVEPKQLGFQRHDILADTKKKFTFASSQPKPYIAKQNSRNPSPVVKNGNSYIKNFFVSMEKKKMQLEVKPKILRGPTAPKPPLKIAFQAGPKTSFTSIKPATEITTRESVSLSNSLITASAQSIPSTGLISFKDFVAKRMKIQSDEKEYHQIAHNQYVNTSLIQQTAVSNLYDPLPPNPYSSGPPDTALKPFATFKKQERRPSTGKSDEGSSISAILGTTYKQSFMIGDSANHTADINSNKKANSGQSQRMQHFPKIEQRQALDGYGNNSPSIIYPTSPTKYKVQEQRVPQNQQTSPMRNQNQLIANYMIQDSQKAQKQSIPHEINSIKGQNLEITSTPTRPTTKHKYNSTIVEIRDQDSIDQSFRSDQHLDEQYVVQQLETGSRYEGFKSNGLRNGIGKFYYTDGGYYDGHWKDNQMDGFGKLYYQGGALAYQGHWAKDEFSGIGKVYNDTPVQFTQPFDYSDFDQLQDYWLFYEGMLMHDAKDGRGKIHLSNGELFEGDFHLDLIQGFGKFHTLDGRVIEGIWRESKLIKVINNIGQKN